MNDILYFLSLVFSFMLIYTLLHCWQFFHYCVPIHWQVHVDCCCSAGEGGLMLLLEFWCIFQNLLLVLSFYQNVQFVLLYNKLLNDWSQGNSEFCSL